MNMEFRRKLPIPKDIKEMFPINEKYAALREEKVKEIENILAGRLDHAQPTMKKLCLIIF